MNEKNKPPKIKFFEPEAIRIRHKQYSLIHFIRACSFGILKTDAQASLAVIVLIITGMVCSYYFIKERKTIPPTTHYEILPQESVGSSVGLPPPVAQYE